MAEVLVHTRDDEVEEYSADEIEMTDHYCRTTKHEQGERIVRHIPHERVYEIRDRVSPS